MPGSTIDELLTAIASLSEDERRELFSRLGVEPSPARQALRRFKASRLVHQPREETVKLLGH